MDTADISSSLCVSVVGMIYLGTGTVFGITISIILKTSLICNSILSMSALYLTHFLVLG